MVTGRTKFFDINCVTGSGSPKCANTGTSLNLLVIALLVHSSSHIAFPITLLLTASIVHDKPDHLAVHSLCCPLEGGLYTELYVY